MTADPKMAFTQWTAPCIGGPADGMRVTIRPDVKSFIEVECDYLSAMEESRNWNLMRPRKSVRYIAERLCVGDADLYFYRNEAMSVEHALFHLIRGYTESSK